MRAAPFTIGLLALALASCSPSDSEPTASAEQNDPASLEIRRASFRDGPGSVNSYWLEGPDEILVFDTQGEIKLAERVVRRIRRTGKAVTAIIVSHFGGISAFVEAFPDAELLMAEAVADQISRDPSGYGKRLRETQGEAYRAPPEPTRLIENREQLSVSGVPVIVNIVDGAKAASMVMLSAPSEQALLAADLVANRMHPDFTDADIDRWPRALERATRDFSGYTLYPGHGVPDPVNLLAANQSAYISFMRNQVERNILDDDVATEAETNETITAILSNYPGW